MNETSEQPANQESPTPLEHVRIASGERLIDVLGKEVWHVTRGIGDGQEPSATRFVPKVLVCDGGGSYRMSDQDWNAQARPEQLVASDAYLRRLRLEWHTSQIQKLAAAS